VEARTLDEVPETSNQDENALSQSDTSTDEPTPLSPEVVASSEPQTEAEAPATDSNDDPEQSSDESSVPAIYEPEVPSTSSPAYEAETRSPERLEHISLSITIARVRKNRGSGIGLTVRSSPSTHTNGGRPVRFTIEGNDPRVVDRFKAGRVIVGPENLDRGFDFFRTGPALRLTIEFER
jgi:hypothetical protein